MPNRRVSVGNLSTLYFLLVIIFLVQVVQVYAANLDFTSSFGTGDLSLNGGYANGILDGQMLYSEMMGEGYNELTIASKVFNASLNVNLSVSNGQYNGFVLLDMPPDRPTGDIKMNITGDSNNLYVNAKFDVVYGKYPINDPKYGLETWYVDKNLVNYWERYFEITLPKTSSTRDSLLNKTYGIMSVLSGTTSRENIIVGGIIVGERATINGRIGGGVNWLLLNPLCVFPGGKFQKPSAESVWKYKALETTLQNVKDGKLYLSYSPKDKGLDFKITGKLSLDKIVNIISDPILLPSEWAISKMGLTSTIDPASLEFESNLVTAIDETMYPPAPPLTISPTAATGNSYSGGTTKINLSVKSEGTPISGASVSLTSDKGGTFSNVKDHGNSTYSAIFTAPVVTKDTLCTITATASKTGYTDAQAQIKITIASSAPLTIVTTANPNPTFSGGTTAVKATLTSGGTPVTGASVSFSSDNGGTFSATTEQSDGSYTVSFITPDLVAQNIYSITVSASKSGFTSAIGQIQITVKPLEIKIMVKDPDGNSLPDVLLTSTSQPSGQAALSKSTGADGSATFTGLIKGSYTFKASKTGYEEKTWAIPVSVGQEKSESITLTKPTELPWTLIIGALILVAGAVLLLMRKRT